MAHQIKILMSNRDVEAFTDVIEADESFSGGLNKNRHAHKKVPNSQGRSTKDETPIFGMIERHSGKVSAHVVDDTKGETLKEKLGRRFQKKMPSSSQMNGLGMLIYQKNICT